MCGSSFHARMGSRGTWYKVCVLKPLEVEGYDTLITAWLPTSLVTILELGLGASNRSWGVRTSE